MIKAAYLQRNEHCLFLEAGENAHLKKKRQAPLCICNTLGDTYPSCFSAWPVYLHHSAWKQRELSVKSLNIFPCVFTSSHIMILIFALNLFPAGVLSAWCMCENVVSRTKQQEWAELLHTAMSEKLTLTCCWWKMSQQMLQVTQPSVTNGETVNKDSME